MTSTLTFAANELSREFRIAATMTGADSAEIQMARMLMEIGVIAEIPANVPLALSAAARLVEQGHLASQIRRNFGIGGITFELVHRAVTAAEGI